MSYITAVNPDNPETEWQVNFNNGEAKLFKTYENALAFVKIKEALQK